MRRNVAGALQRVVPAPGAARVSLDLSTDESLAHGLDRSNDPLGWRRANLVFSGDGWTTTEPDLSIVEEVAVEAGLWRVVVEPGGDGGRNFVRRVADWASDPPAP